MCVRSRTTRHGIGRVGSVTKTIAVRPASLLAGLFSGSRRISQVRGGERRRRFVAMTAAKRS